MQAHRQWVRVIQAPPATKRLSSRVSWISGPPAMGGAEAELQHLFKNEALCLFKTIQCCVSLDEGGRAVSALLAAASHAASRHPSTPPWAFRGGNTHQHIGLGADGSCTDTDKSSLVCLLAGWYQQNGALGVLEGVQSSAERGPPPRYRLQRGAR